MDKKKLMGKDTTVPMQVDSSKNLKNCPQDHQFYRRKANPFSFSTKPKTPDEILNLAKQCLFYWLHRLLMVTRITADPRHFNVDMPYCVVPIIKGPIPEEMMWYIWALSAQYDCAIAVPAFTLYIYFVNHSSQERIWTSYYQCLLQFLFGEENFTMLCKIREYGMFPTERSRNSIASLS
ncbi:hypothetical protein PIB30_069596 [Stylosanthes scabra]|uniref:Uncharacterized protein n=1 Tax=Stylosanthes scabra TaxID=79078 RepID=A0ABU6XNI8_9FABA|nr:hypothetical protein [Stylosanthes scabra]